MNLDAFDPQAREIIQRYDEPRAAMLPLLWLVQEELGHIPSEAEFWVGRRLGVAVSHVREVVSFYSMFRTKPAGRRELRICTSLPCLLRGADDVLVRIEHQLGVRAGETTPGGELTVTEVECLCACEIAPMAQLDEQFVGPLDGPGALDAILRDALQAPAFAPAGGATAGKPGDASREPQPFISTAGPVLSTRLGNADGTWWDAYVASGGYVAAKRALSLKPDQIIDEISRSNLRGLGGAGFPTARKWSFIPKNSAKPIYLVVNADEGEPGTFKDRYLLERDPHALLEGMIIAAYSIGSHKAYVYIRGEYFRSAQRVNRAVQEAYAHGWLGTNIQGSGFDLDVVIHRGAGAYICGEETALLTSLEGGKGFPKLKPPFPAISGLFHSPTIVNNVETLACVPFILREGAERFAGLGTSRQGGTRLFSVCGHVTRPGLYEAPVGVSLRELIEGSAQGVREGRTLKAVVPGGISAKVLTASEIDVHMDFDSLMAAGSMAGSGGVIVMDDTSCMVEALQCASKFFAHESCGQCSPCREGTGWVYRILRRIGEGKGRIQDLDDLLAIARDMEGKTICVFADAAAWPVQSYITKFREEFEDHIRTGTCANDRGEGQGAGGKSDANNPLPLTPHSSPLIPHPSPLPGRL
jgi:NADH-quinone oxidoreductase subunit F